MTFGEYYRTKRRGFNPGQAMANARENVLKRARGKATVANCKKLEKFFNHAFYPEKYRKDAKGAEYNSRITQLINQAYQQKYDAVLNNFSMGASNVTYGVSLDQLPGLIRDRYESFNHQNRIYTQTLQTRLEKVKAALNDINGRETTAEINAYRTELLSLQSLLDSLLAIKDVGSDKAGTFLSLADNEDVFKMVAEMDAKYQAASSVGGIFMPQDYGQVLEWVLQAFSHDDNTGPVIEGVTEEMISEEILKKITSTAGSQTAGVGGSGLSMSMSIKYDGNQVKKNTQDKSFEISDGQGNSFSFKAVQGFKPNSDRQGKMDVNFTFKDGNSYIPFRISAKNWQTLDRDFGSTNLAYALIRTIGEESGVGYAFAMQDEENANIVEKSHQLAKYTILADVLMGYSQRNNYADTILINDRQGQRVIVLSMVNLMSKLYDNIKDLNIQGYHGEVIHKNMTTLRRALDKAERANKSEEYRQLALKYMQSIQVAVHFYNIAPYIQY